MTIKTFAPLVITLRNIRASDDKQEGRKYGVGCNPGHILDTQSINTAMQYLYLEDLSPTSLAPSERIDLVKLQGKLPA
ncbi:unnamed protein product [Toxocara canis]|uniref:DUF1659 domain-containing protein n=1 Tax=Toxocara canis TaxID=6265 RepID=A0A183U9H3_TOXCA|nr:unnamed protein product [Toxocara canis]